MKGIFNLEGPLFTLINKAVNIVFASFLWAIFSIPIITIGASTTALYYVTVKVIRKERGYVFREFWSSFKSNFIQSTILWLIMILITIIMCVDIEYSKALEGTYGIVSTAIFRGMSIILFFTSLYIFPNISRFKMNFKQLIKNSFIIAMKHLPTTILLAIVVLGVLVLLLGPMYLYSFMYFFASEPISVEEFAQGVASSISVLMLMVLFVPGIGSLLSSFIVERILKKYMPAKGEQVELDENGEEIIKDEWYLD